jgi:hypothetical protein
MANTLKMEDVDARIAAAAILMAEAFGMGNRQSHNQKGMVTAKWGPGYDC